MKKFKIGDIAYYFNGSEYLRCKMDGISTCRFYYGAFFETGFPAPNSHRAIHISEMLESPREISLKILLDD